MFRSKCLAAVLIALALFCTPGCLGRFTLSGNIRKFNMEATEDKWGREGVFVLLYVIPVYPTCGAIDLFILNSIEFWSGENPITGEPPLAEAKVPAK